jgi:hypothetical protein
MTVRASSSGGPSPQLQEVQRLYGRSERRLDIVYFSDVLPVKPCDGEPLSAVLTREP